MVFKKKFLSLAIISFSLLLLHSPAYAATLVSQQTLDNDNGVLDSSQNGYSPKAAWVHGDYTNDYLGDHRLSTTGGTYQWYFKSQTSTTRQYHVYLRNPNFTCVNAYYYVATGKIGQVYYLDPVGSINQNTAYPGWNKIGSNISYSSDAYYLDLEANSGCPTGADGAEVDFYQ